MAIKKTQIGFHDVDGGPVYKVGGPNSLISYFYCNFCKASSSLGNLKLDNVLTDLTQLDSGSVPGRDLQGTDIDFKSAFKELTDNYQASFPSVMRDFVPSDSPWQRKHVIEGGLNVTKAAADSAPETVENMNTDFLTQSTFKSSAEFTGSLFSSGSFTTYFENGIAGVESATGVSNTPDYWTGIYQTNDAVEGSFETQDVPTNDFSYVYVTLVAPSDITGSYPDWTRTENVKIEVSNNGGISWEACKYLVADSTDYPSLNAWSNWVKFSSSAGIFKARVTFNAGNVGTPGILALHAYWDYDPSDNAYIQGIIDTQMV